MKSAVGDRDSELDGLEPHFVGSLLNIFSMRSVMRKPLMMLVIDAKSAMAPSSVMSGGDRRP